MELNEAREQKNDPVCFTALIASDKFPQTELNVQEKWWVNSISEIDLSICKWVIRPLMWCYHSA